MARVPTAVNGKYPTQLLATLPGVDGDGTPHQADLLAVASYDAMRVNMQRDGLGDLVPSSGFSAYRTLADQQYMVDIGATTAPPGTSIHGEAAAVDFADLGGWGAPRHTWMTRFAGAYGWYQPAWCAVDQLNEPWHWEYDPELDTHTPPSDNEDPQEVEDMAGSTFTAKDPRGQFWLIDGVFRRPISAQQSEALAALAAPATIPFQQGIGDTALGAFANIDGAYRPVVTEA